MSATSENGYLVLFENRTTGSLPRLRKWIVPGTEDETGKPRHLFLRDGSVGFVLVWIALWFHEVIERLDLGIWDEWGWAVRPVRGQLTGYSNHASGSAEDLNATRHPRGVPIAKTFTPVQIRRIRRMLRIRTLGFVRWGGDYKTTVDGMHFEIAPGAKLSTIERIAKTLALSSRGRRILAANPGAREVIYS